MGTLELKFIPDPDQRPVRYMVPLSANNEQRASLDFINTRFLNNLLNGTIKYFDASICTKQNCPSYANMSQFAKYKYSLNAAAANVLSQSLSSDDVRFINAMLQTTGRLRRTLTVSDIVAAYRTTLDEIVRTIILDGYAYTLGQDRATGALKYAPYYIVTENNVSILDALVYRLAYDALTKQFILNNDALMSVLSNAITSTFNSMSSVFGNGVIVAKLTNATITNAVLNAGQDNNAAYINAAVTSIDRELVMLTTDNIAFEVFKYVDAPVKHVRANQLLALTDSAVYGRFILQLFKEVDAKESANSIGSVPLIARRDEHSQREFLRIIQTAYVATAAKRKAYTRSSSTVTIPASRADIETYKDMPVRLVAKTIDTTLVTTPAEYVKDLTVREAAAFYRKIVAARLSLSATTTATQATETQSNVLTAQVNYSVGSSILDTQGTLTLPLATNVVEVLQRAPTYGIWLTLVNTATVAVFIMPVTTYNKFASRNMYIPYQALANTASKLVGWKQLRDNTAVYKYAAVKELPFMYSFRIPAYSCSAILNSTNTYNIKSAKIFYDLLADQAPIEDLLQTLNTVGIPLVKINGVSIDETVIPENSTLKNNYIASADIKHIKFTVDGDIQYASAEKRLFTSAPILFIKFNGSIDLSKVIEFIVEAIVKTALLRESVYIIQDNAITRTSVKVEKIQLLDATLNPVPLVQSGNTIDMLKTIKV